MTNEPKHINILDQPQVAPPEEEDADLAQFLSNMNWKDEAVDEQLFDPTLPDLQVCHTLEWQGVAFAPLGGIAGMNGRPGNGKTMSFSTMIAAILKGEYQGLKCMLPGEPTVLYIDTEMEMVNTQRTVRRIYQMVGWEQRTQQDRLHTICLREVNDATSRWRKILKAVWQFKPQVVFLDGLIDVVNDFNDNKECQDRIYQCMSVASHYNISMWCLLHLNPGSDKAVGHLGSFLERKATDIWLTAQDKDTQCITISHEKHRMRKAPDISYKVGDDENHYGIPTINHLTIVEPKKVEEKPKPEKTPSVNAQLTLDEVLLRTNNILANGPMKKTDIAHRLGGTYQTTLNKINELVEQGHLMYDSDGNITNDPL